MEQEAVQEAERLAQEDWEEEFKRQHEEQWDDAFARQHDIVFKEVWDEWIEDADDDEEDDEFYLTPKFIDTVQQRMDDWAVDWMPDME